jgi:malate dehydrogenase (oxaloacetate-decarboxylating)(NADP+)
VIHAGRKEGMNSYKQEFAGETSARTLADALKGADVFVGLSQAGCVTQEMVRTMAPKPIIFAMANPDPEITPDEVKAVRDDAITATGRSDYPNQVNNVLGFPFIFRGALDVRASKINEAMKQAAVQALAELARRGEAIPDVVRRAYPNESMDFGPSYIIPKPFDPRVLLFVAPAVAQAAMDSGVARRPVDIGAYESQLQQRIGEISAL